MESPEPHPRKKKRRLRRESAVAQTQKFYQEDWQRFLSGLKKSLTGVLISLGLHVLLLVIMGLIIIQIPNDQFAPLQLGWSTLVESSQNQSTPEIAVIEIPAVKMSNTDSSSSVIEVKPVPAQQVSPTQTHETPKLALSDVSQSLALRKETKPGEGDASGAGAKQGTTRQAIDLALTWIVRQQQPGGYWELTGPYPDAGTIDTKSGATALSLLALLGDGNTPTSGKYQQAVQQGLDWLVRNQKSNGDLFDALEEGREPHFYAHSQGTIALCEAVALSGEETYRGPAERAVRFLISAQNPVLGGWKYRQLTAQGIGDLSVTGWALMALHSARMAQIDVPFETFLLAERFLNSVQEQATNGSFYKYRPDFPIEELQRWPMTAEGLLCRQWLGWPKNYPEMRRGVEFLLSEKNKPEWEQNRRNVYAWYYTAQTLHNLGGNYWKQWYANVSKIISDEQAQSGTQRGSWHPTRPQGAFQERSHDAGRLYLSVMCVLILETPQRHAALYEATD